ncbi:irregular chiasm C-roughest protein-like protein [Leptotrombidium deliense]|uniref:Irregular chiasm C-roughest protein-like protein n=1 Tax=Leptotrombidium deliense TaxID=299467 RepID=A0A443SVU5_9ACAR|nr:irregular chiasm C-roughest protein-like protein [Leptotrombidium deliense]
MQWTRDGFGLGSDRDLIGFPRYSMTGSDDEGDFSLQIVNVQLEDDALFQCQVGASEGAKGIRSRDAVITVSLPPEPPKIVQGDNLKTTAGMTVELTCESHSGKPPAELTWLDGDGNPVSSSSTQSSTQLLSDGKRANAMLKWTFQASREHNGKTFICRSENPALSKPQKSLIKIEVKYPPDVKLTVNSTNIGEFDDVRFTCEASANPADIVYKWYKNNEVVVGDYSTTFEIRKISRNYNKAEISCEVSNSVGTTKATHTLDVHFGPAFKSAPEKVLSADIGSEVKLNCDVDGNPKPKVVWLFNSSPKVLSTERELIIPEMTYEKSGKYICRAAVEGFPEIWTSTLVFIKGPPRVKSSPFQFGVEGETVKLECVVHFIPPARNITWFRNTQNVKSDINRGIEIIEEEFPSQSLLRSTLVIHKSRKEHFGAYNCSVSNEFGNNYLIITLSKQKSFPMLIIVAAIIGGVVAVVSVTIIVILCMKRKSNSDDCDYGHDMKKEAVVSNTTSSSIGKLHSHHSVMDTGSSGADSDLKVEIRTASSLSEHGQCWDDLNDMSSERNLTANDIAQVVENIYNYTSEPIFQTNKETQNNNGFIPYVDLSREYLSGHTSSSQLGQQGTLQHASIVMTSNRDSYIDPHYGTLSIDPRYRNSNYSAYSRAASNGSPVTSASALVSAGVYSANQRYITSPSSGTLATHV